MDSSYPECFARFYDVIYSKVRSGVDTEYFLGKIAAARGPVLEAGVGTGRLFRAALSRGADIYGIDISTPMLEVLKSKIPASEHRRLSLQDIRDFRFDAKFCLIAAPFRVFMHLTETGGQLGALNNVYDHLRDGGEFVFDLYVPDPKYLADGLTDFVDFEGEHAPGEILRRTVTSRNDLIRQINKITMKFEWTEGGERSTCAWESELRFFFRFELEYLLKLSRFSSFSIYGDYEEGPLSGSSKDFVVVCCR